MEQIDEEPLMNLRPKTDFERLLWANNRIKELEKELTGSKQEAVDLIGQLEDIKEVLKLNSKQLRLQVISLKSERNKLKVNYDALLYKHTMLQINFNLLDFK